MTNRIVFNHLRIVGLGLFACSLLFYRSYENRQVLDRWSMSFFLIIVFCWTMFLLTLIWAVRRGRTKGDPNRPRVTDLLSFDLAILFWGMAYFIEAASNGANAARITALNVFGSTHPAAVILGWMSLVCAFVAITMFVFPRLKEKYKYAAYSDRGAVSQHMLDLAEFVNLASRAGAIVRVVHFDFNMARHPDLRPVYDNFTRQSIAAGIPTWTLNSQ